jgi:hypothetical protein
VLDLLVTYEALADELRSRMLGWRHAEFSAHNEVRVTAEDAEGRKRLAGYTLRAPMSLEKMTYDAVMGNRRARFDSGRVFYPVTDHQIGRRCWLTAAGREATVRRLAQSDPLRSSELPVTGHSRPLRDHPVPDIA